MTGQKKKHIDFLQDLEFRYPGIRKQFGIMFKNPYWTLKRVAEQYGFSREYARQLFQQISGLGARDLIALRKRQKREDMACVYDPRYKVAEYQEGTIKNGAIAEKIVFERCEVLGFDVKPSVDRAYDLEINDFRVDVKSSWKAGSRGGQAVSKYYSFSLSIKQQKMCDFLICLIMPLKISYIVPRIEFPDFTGKPAHIHIRSTPTNQGGYPDKQKWFQYREAWHLLQAG